MSIKNNRKIKIILIPTIITIKIIITIIATTKINADNPDNQFTETNAKNILKTTKYCTKVKNNQAYKSKI